MSIHAFVTTIWTGPEPAVFLIFNRLNKILANFLRCRPRVPVFAQDHISQLGFVPLFHGILLLSVITFCISRIRVQVPLCRLSLHAEVVAEFAFFALFAMALLEKLAHNGLRVDTKGHFLHLHGLEKLGCFSLGLLLGGFFGGSTSLFGFFAFLVRILVGFRLRFELGYLTSCTATFFL